MRILAYRVYVYISHAHPTCSNHSHCSAGSSADNWCTRFKFGNSLRFRGNVVAEETVQTEPQVQRTRHGVRPPPCDRHRCLGEPRQPARLWILLCGLGTSRRDGTFNTGGDQRQHRNHTHPRPSRCSETVHRALCRASREEPLREGPVVVVLKPHSRGGCSASSERVSFVA